MKVVVDDDDVVNCYGNNFTTITKKTLNLKISKNYFQIVNIKFFFTELFKGKKSCLVDSG